MAKKLVLLVVVVRVQCHNLILRVCWQCCSVQGSSYFVKCLLRLKCDIVRFEWQFFPFFVGVITF